MTDTTQTAPAKREARPIDLLSQAFESMGQNFEELLPAHVTLKRFKQVVMTAVAASPDLMAVSATPEGRRSIIMSSLKCASDGLIPDNREAALVKFKPKDGPAVAQYMPMVRGIITKMQQSTSCKEVRVNLVHKNDRLVYIERSTETEFLHEPVLFGDAGELIGAYAFLRTTQGGFYIAPLNKSDLDKIKKSSKSQYGPWSGPFESEMHKKSALKRLSKIAPVSREVLDIVAYDNETFHEIEGAPRKSALERLQEQQALAHDEMTVDVTPTMQGAEQRERVPAAKADAAEAEDEQAAETEGEVGDQPAAEAEPSVRELPPKPGALIRTKKGVMEWARAWAAYWLAIPKEDEDAFWDETEADQRVCIGIDPKTEEIFNGAINSKGAPA